MYNTLKRNSILGIIASIVTILTFIFTFLPDVIPPPFRISESMPVGRFYMHDGENFMDELIGEQLANMTVFEFRGRGQGTQHLPGVGAVFEYRYRRKSFAHDHRWGNAGPELKRYKTG